MERRTESIVPMLAISPTDSEVARMSNEQMKREKTVSNHYEYGKKDA